MYILDSEFSCLMAKISPIKKVFEKFKPEGGAYGMGRTHSHKH